MDLDLNRAIVMRIPTLIKARPPERGGRRIVEVEASTEEIDADGDCVLQKALLNASSEFVAGGHLDIDHYSEIGYQIGIANPMAYVVGSPLEVIALAGGRTSVIGEIRKSPDGITDIRRHQFDMFWDSIQRDPPVQWFSSIFGYPTDWEDCESGICIGTDATRYVIKALNWSSLAFTRTPKNTALKGSARIVMAKSLIADLAKAMGSGTIEERLARLEAQQRRESAVSRPQVHGSPSRPVQVLAPHHMAVAAERVGKPTPAQAQAGNYAHGHVIINGLDIAIETPMGAVRRGVHNGVEWAVRMPVDYGRIKKTDGADGEDVDVYVGPHCHRAGDCPIWIVDQVDADTRDFDEHKTFIGFESSAEAKRAYHGAFSDGRGADRTGAVKRVTFDEFMAWLANGDTKSPVALGKAATEAVVFGPRHHGHVTPAFNPHDDNAQTKVRCGGPAMCSSCAQEWLGKHGTPYPAMAATEKALDTSDIASPPGVRTLDTMESVWSARTCEACGVGDNPSLLGYRHHFVKCMGCSPGHADVAAHALMHKQNMSRT